MKEANFKRWLQRIENADPTFALIVEKDLSQLSPEQWNRLSEMVIKKGFSAFVLWYGESGHYSNEVWQAFFTLLTKARISKFTVGKDETIISDQGLDWGLFFTCLKASPVKELAFHLLHLCAMPETKWDLFLKAFGNSNVEALLFSGDDFGEASREFCFSFFTKLAGCKNLRRLSFTLDFTLGACDDFWVELAANVSKLGIQHLVFEQIGLHHIAKEHWLNFCRGAGLSTSLKSLSIAKNELHKLTSQKWEWIFEGLRVTPFSELNIEQDHPLDLKGEKRQSFLQGLRKTPISTLRFRNYKDDNDLAAEIAPILEANRKKTAKMLYQFEASSRENSDNKKVVELNLIETTRLT